MEEGRDVEEVERGVKEAENGGEDEGDMKVEEEDQLIEDHCDHENSSFIPCSLSITITNIILHSLHPLYVNHLPQSQGKN